VALAEGLIQDVCGELTTHRMGVVAHAAEVTACWRLRVGRWRAACDDSTIRHKGEILRAAMRWAACWLPASRCKSPATAWLGCRWTLTGSYVLAWALVPGE
jgi:hypothetical protein